MKIFVFLVIFFATVCLSFQRLPMGGCDRDAFFFEYINPTIGWIGVGAVNLGTDDRLDNITISVKMETRKLENTSNLGEIRKLHFSKIQTSDSIPKYSIFFEIRLPMDNPLPNIINISVDGYGLCENPVQSNDTTHIVLGYIFNSYHNTERKFSELIESSVYTPITKFEVENIMVSELEPKLTIDCGKIGPFDDVVPSILDGKTIPRGGWPWIISIYSYNHTKLEFQCGGTLVSNTLIVTAAHCFYDSNNRKVKTDDVVVILGQYNLKRPYDTDSNIMYPDSVNIHPDYKKRNHIDSDIAVVVFKKSIQFTTFIRPACLWKESVSKESIIGLQGVTAGWGRDQHGNFFTELPKKVEVSVVSDEMCHDAFSNITSEVTFCADWRNGTQGSCNADSGGGLIFLKEGRWTLRGVVSTVLSDKKSSVCEQKKHAVFTDIVPFIHWIKSFSDTPDVL